MSTAYWIGNTHQRNNYPAKITYHNRNGRVEDYKQKTEL